MCRLYGFRANESTKVECTLVHAQNALMIQSRSDLRGVSHTDGWGIAVFDHGQPVLEKRGAAAYEDLHFSSTAERTYSTAVVAHVRRATIGETSTLNTHPFSYGSWVFAHNGTIAGFDRLSDELERETDAPLQQRRRGTTDSEQAFFWLLTRMERAGIASEAPCADPFRLLEVFREAVRELAGRSEPYGDEEPARLNFLLTDGRSMVASRWANDLHLTVREGVRDCEICGIPHVDHDPDGPPYRAAVLASEPISHEDWQDVPDRHSVLVEPGIRVSIEKM